MKKGIMLVFMVLFAASMAQCQDVPEAVKLAFAKKFPDLEVAQWEQEDDGYEAEFKLEGSPTEALFADNGEWVETEKLLRPRDVPKDVLKKAKKNYASYEIMKAEWVESASEGEYYELELMGVKTLELKVFPNGKMMVEEVNDDDDEDE